MTSLRKLRLDRRWPEVLLTLLVLGGLANTIHRFILDGKLPQPFIFDVNDTFMDWFNTAVWAHNPGAFDIWRTVYPPLSFLFLMLLGPSRCYIGNGVSARDCDHYGVVAIVVCYLIGGILAWVAFRRRDRSTSTLRGLSFMFGLPWLFTLERGNLILPCFAAFVLAHGDVLRSPRARTFAMAITINFKPYLLLPVLSLAWERRWRMLELAGFATVAIYLISYAAYGAGSIFEVASNTANWVQFTGGLLFEQIYYSTSFAPFLQFDTPNFPTRDFIPDQVVTALLTTIPIVIRASQAVALLVLAGAWVQPGVLARSRISLLLLAASLIGQSPGGYTEVFLIFLLFLEPCRRTGPIIALTMGYLLSVPFDYTLSNIITIVGDSWLGGRPVEAPFGVTIGTFLRPGLIVILFWALALDSLALIVRAHRERRPTLDPHPRALRQGDVAA